MLYFLIMLWIVDIETFKPLEIVVYPSPALYASTSSLGASCQVQPSSPWLQNECVITTRGTHIISSSLTFRMLYSQINTISFSKSVRIKFWILKKHYNWHGRGESFCIAPNFRKNYTYEYNRSKLLRIWRIIQNWIRNQLFMVNWVSTDKYFLRKYANIQ